MPTTLTGTIAGNPVPPEQRTHMDAPDFVAPGEQPQGSEQVFELQGYRNTGNVPQVVTFDGISGANNCSFVYHRWQTPTGLSPAPSVTLQPNQSITMRIAVQLVSNPNVPTLPFGFTVNTTWS